MCGFIRVTELLSVLYVLHFIQPGAPSWPTVPVLWLVSWPQPGPLIGWPDPELAHTGHSSEYQSTYFQLQPHRTSPASFIHKINYTSSTQVSEFLDINSIYNCLVFPLHTGGSKSGPHDFYCTFETLERRNIFLLNRIDLILNEWILLNALF